MFCGMAEKARRQIWSQERIVLAIAVILFVVSAVTLRGFLDSNNLISIVRSVSVLGILAVGMAIVIIGRGIDLAAVAIMAMSAAWYLQLLNDGTPEGTALLMVVAGVLLATRFSKLPPDRVVMVAEAEPPPA